MVQNCANCSSSLQMGCVQSQVFSEEARDSGDEKTALVVSMHGRQESDQGKLAKNMNTSYVQCS